jgi:hypothetical protein
MPGRSLFARLCREKGAKALCRARPGQSTVPEQRPADSARLTPLRIREKSRRARPKIILRPGKCLSPAMELERPPKDIIEHRLAERPWMHPLARFGD